MKTLDINTPLGQETLRQEREAVRLWESLNPLCTYAPTHKGSACPVDGILLHEGVVSAVVETKCRMVEEEEFFGKFKGEWLVTFSKLEKGKTLSDLLGIPLVGFLYLVPSRVLLVRRIAENGQFCAPMRITKTETQATVNGGMANRFNAYIAMTGTEVKRFEAF